MAAPEPQSPTGEVPPEQPTGRLEDLSARELKELLREKGLSDGGCFERTDLVERLRGAGEDLAADRGSAEPKASPDPAASEATTASAPPSTASTPPREESSPLKTSLASEWLGRASAGEPEGEAAAEEPAAPAAAADAAQEQAAAAGVGKTRPGSAAPSRPRQLDFRAINQLTKGNRRLRGRVKVFNTEKNFAFVDCQDTKPLLGRDVYVSGLDLQEVPLAVGDQVSFVVKIDRESRPRALFIKVEESGPIPCPDAPRRSDPEPDKLYSGVVKSFHIETGFGFVACDEVHAAYSRDAFLHHSQRSGASVGDTVTFRIEVIKGMPKVKDLEVVSRGEAPAGAEGKPDARLPLEDPGEPSKAGGKATPAVAAKTAVAGAARVEARPSGLCRNFLTRGACIAGDNCRYRHVESEVEATARKRLQDVCVHHLADTCRWDMCQKRHPPEAEAEELRSLAAQVPCFHGKTCRTVNCLYTHPVGHIPIGSAAATLESMRAGGAKRRDGSAPPRFACPAPASGPVGGERPRRPAAGASGSPPPGLPPRPSRPVPTDEDTGPSSKDAWGNWRGGRGGAAKEPKQEDARSHTEQLGDWQGLTFQEPAAAAAPAREDGESERRAEDKQPEEATPPADAAVADAAPEEPKAQAPCPAEIDTPQGDAMATEAAAAAEAAAPARGDQAATEASATSEGAASAQPAADRPAPGTPGAGPPWQKYSYDTEEGQGVWWWCEADGDWFKEAEPGPWVQYSDPTSDRHYWWKDEGKWFWA